MPYSLWQESIWDIDHGVFASLPGAQKLIEWFGFVPDFHDASLVAAKFSIAELQIIIHASRMSDKLDDAGFFIHDGLVSICIQLYGVSAVQMRSTLITTLIELGVRRTDDLLELPDTARKGDLELCFDDVCGGSCSIFASRIEIAFEPRMPSED